MFRPFEGHRHAKILVIKHKKTHNSSFTQPRAQFNISFSHIAVQHGLKIKKILKQKYVADGNGHSEFNISFLTHSVLQHVNEIGKNENSVS